MDEPRKNAEHANKGYEESEVNAGRLIAFAAGVIGLVVVGVVGSLVVFKFFVSHESLGPPASPFENARSLPPEPRLQTRAPLDLDHYRAQQQKILDSYGWVDPPAGVVRIPVNRAMDLLLQKGYPVSGSAPVNGQPNTPGETPPPPNLQTAPTPVFGEGGVPQK
jgi:hypothetical protein